MPTLLLDLRRPFPRTEPPVRSWKLTEIEIFEYINQKQCKNLINPQNRNSCQDLKIYCHKTKNCWKYATGRILGQQQSKSGNKYTNKKHAANQFTIQLYSNLDTKFTFWIRLTGSKQSNYKSWKIRNSWNTSCSSQRTKITFKLLWLHV